MRQTDRQASLTDMILWIIQWHKISVAQGASSVAKSTHSRPDSTRYQSRHPTGHQQARRQRDRQTAGQGSGVHRYLQEGRSELLGQRGALLGGHAALRGLPVHLVAHHNHRHLAQQHTHTCARFANSEGLLIKGQEHELSRRCDISSGGGVRWLASQSVSQSHSESVSRSPDGLGALWRFAP